MSQRALVGLLVVGCATPDGAVDSDPRDTAPDAFTVVTWNTGTATPGDDDGPYTPALAAIVDDAYGHAMAWTPAEQAATAWLADVKPDVVAFQEIVWDGLCAEVTHDDTLPLVCSTWDSDGPTQPQRVLGDGWQVMCHVGKPDKCVGVRRSFGSFVGCDADLCLDGAWGGEVEGCGSGARVARSVIARTDGTTLTLVSVHGSSGASAEDAACRVSQLERVFVDLGDGEPAANGDVNLILGDLNTDPGRLTGVDASARRWLDFVGEGTSFSFLTSIDPDDPPTYAGLVSIDHVLSDGLVAAAPCWHPGVTSDRPPVMDVPFFDHAPAVCRLEPR